MSGDLSHRSAAPATATTPGAQAAPASSQDISNQQLQSVLGLDGGSSSAGELVGHASQAVATAQYAELLHNASLTQQGVGDVLRLQSQVGVLEHMPVNGTLDLVGNAGDVLGAATSLATIVQDGANPLSIDTQMAAADLVSQAVGRAGPVGQAFAFGWSVGRWADGMLGLSDAISSLATNVDVLDLGWATMVQRLDDAGYGPAIVLNTLYRLRALYEDHGAALVNDAAQRTGMSWARAEYHSSDHLQEQGQDAQWEQVFGACMADGGDWRSCAGQATRQVPSPQRVEELIEEGEELLRDAIDEYRAQQRQSRPTTPPRSHNSGGLSTAGGPQA